jgi:lysyl-tRNA synthetase class I
VNVYSEVKAKINVASNNLKKKSRDYINELVKNANKWKENYEPESAPMEDDELKLKQDGFQEQEPIHTDGQNDEATEEEK